MYKDGSSISIDKLSEVKGDFENGLEVKLDYNGGYNAIGKIARETHELQYFPSLYIQDDTGERDFTTFNNRKIYRNKHFVTSDYLNRCGIGCVIGNVRYPIESPHISELQGIATPIDLLFNIGDLDITPNREALRYSPKTINAIKDKVNSVIEELREEAKNNDLGNFTNVLDLYDYLTNDTVTFVLNGGTIKTTKQFCILNNIDLNIRLNNHNIPRGFMQLCVDISKAYYENRVVSSDQCIYEITPDRCYSKDCSSMSFNDIITRIKSNRILHSNGRLTSVSKRYIREQRSISLYNTSYPYYSYIKVVRTSDLNDIKSSIYDRFKFLSNSKEVLKFAIEAFYPLFKDFVNNKSFNNSDVPQSYKDSIKPVVVKTSNVSTVNKKVNTTCSITTLYRSQVYNSEYGGYFISASTAIDSYEDLKKYKGGIVYADKDDMNIKYAAHFYFASQVIYKLKFIQVAASKIHLIKELKNAVHINDFLDKAPKYLRKECEDYSFMQAYKDSYLKPLSIPSYKWSHTFKSCTSAVLDYMGNKYINCRYNNYTYPQGLFIRDLCSKYKQEKKLDLYLEDQLFNNPKIIKIIQFVLYHRLYNLEDESIIINFILQKKLALPNNEAYNRYLNSIYKK